MLNDRENILNVLREKPLKVYEIMKRANVADDGKPSHPLARSSAWRINQSQQRGARFGWHTRRAARNG